MAYIEGEITGLRPASGRVAGKVAVITGSTSGIGRASAVLFAWEGAKVVVSGRREDRGGAVVKEIKDNGGDAVFIRADMTREEDIQNLIKTAIDTYGRIDILFNNAGYMMNKPTLEITREDWDRYLNLDAWSYLRMMQLTLPVMEKQGGGVILNCTSLAAVDINIPDNTLYGFMKAGVNHMSRVIAEEYAGKHIRVNTLLPGLVETEMVKNGPNGEKYDFISTLNPMGRPGTILEAAYAALFLCSDESAYITATSLVIDGGVRGSAGSKISIEVLNVDKSVLAKEIYNISHLKGMFRLRSGQISSEYFDKYLFESNPRILLAIAEHMSKLIPEGTEVLAGLEMGGIPIATALSVKTGIPVVFVRKKAKDYGTCKLAEGMDISGKKVCIIEDVVTTGGQIILSVSDLRKIGADADTVLCVILRNEEGRTKLGDAGLYLKELFTMSDLKSLLELGEIS